MRAFSLVLLAALTLPAASDTPVGARRSLPGVASAVDGNWYWRADKELLAIGRK